jgi:hypothetical protein
MQSGSHPLKREALGAKKMQVDSIRRGWSAIGRGPRQSKFQPSRRRAAFEGGRCIFFLGRGPVDRKLSDTASEPEEIRKAWWRE